MTREGQEFSGNLTQMMNHMAGMIHEMSDALRKGVNTQNKIELSELLRAVSTQMMYLSHIVKIQNVSEREVQILQQRMSLTEKRLSMMQAGRNC